MSPTEFDLSRSDQAFDAAARHARSTNAASLRDEEGASAKPAPTAGEARATRRAKYDLKDLSPAKRRELFAKTKQEFAPTLKAIFPGVNVDGKTIDDLEPQLFCALIFMLFSTYFSEVVKDFGEKQLAALHQARHWTADANSMDKTWVDTPDTGGVSKDDADVKRVIDDLRENHQSIGGRSIDDWLKDEKNLIDGKLKKSAVKELAETCKNISTSCSDLSTTDQANLNIYSNKIATLTQMSMSFIKSWGQNSQIMARG